MEASPAGDAKKEPPEVDEVNFTFGPRQWRVRGVGKNLAFDTLRVQLRVLVHSGGQQCFHLDNLDLCNAKHRNSFIAQAHAETHMDEQLIKRDLAQVFLKVEELQRSNASTRRWSRSRRKSSCRMPNAPRRWSC